jgi:hypothetical protein
MKQTGKIYQAGCLPRGSSHNVIALDIADDAVSKARKVRQDTLNQLNQLKRTRTSIPADLMHRINNTITQLTERA